jgi:hypothetical protein
LAFLVRLAVAAVRRAAPVGDVVGKRDPHLCYCEKLQPFAGIADAFCRSKAFQGMLSIRVTLWIHITPPESSPQRRNANTPSRFRPMCKILI